MAQPVSSTHFDNGDCMSSLPKLCRVAMCLALAVATQARAAEPVSKAADPADPNAAVPATRYQPVLPYRAPRQPERTADQNWKALNQKVGATNSMSLTMGGADEPADSTQAPPAHEHAMPEQEHQHHHHGMEQ